MISTATEFGNATGYVKEILQNSANKIVVSVSGGKDGVAALLKMRYEMDINPDQIIVHHQHLPEQWLGSKEYVQELCAKLKVTFWSDQAEYNGFECLQCQFHYTTIYDYAKCPKKDCRGDGKFISKLTGLLDLVEHRGKFPDQSVRYCTDYLKSRVFNDRMRKEQAKLGEQPVAVLGERWRESKNRENLPFLRERPKLKFMTEYRPILALKRVEAFGTLFKYGIEPIYSYEAQGMTRADMLKDKEGGARNSCALCFFAGNAEVKKAYRHNEHNRLMINRAIRLEEKSGHLWKAKKSIKDAVKEPQILTAPVNILEGI